MLAVSVTVGAVVFFFCGVCENEERARSQRSPDGNDDFLMKIFVFLLLV